MKRAFAIILSAVLIISCQKEIDHGTGGAAGGGDFQPVSANSEWNYSSTNAGTYKIVSIGTDTTINGKKYYKFDNVSPAGSNRYYVNKENSVYTQFIEVSPGGPRIDWIFLKDMAVGSNWTNNVSMMGFSSYHLYNVVARGQQRIVSGQTFNDVIELNYQISIDDPMGSGIRIPIGTGKDYYARGVGAIEQIVDINLLGTGVSDTTRLVSYTIR